jgi:hypothetical protein
MKFKLEIDCGNAAFFEGGTATAPKSEHACDYPHARRREIARILRYLAIRIEDDPSELETSINLYDYNGNHVGVAQEVP